VRGGGDSARTRQKVQKARKSAHISDAPTIVGGALKVKNNQKHNQNHSLSLAQNLYAVSLLTSRIPLSPTFSLSRSLNFPIRYLFLLILYFFQFLIAFWFFVFSKFSDFNVCSLLAERLIICGGVLIC
jgi:hypothetical protein